MSKRLLNEAEALRKIELSLKLQGKAFKANFISCSNCKFCWQNVQGNRPKYSTMVFDAQGQSVVNTAPRPEKYGWYCFKYKGVPYHAYLRFKVARINAEGKEIPVKGRWDTPDGSYTTDPLEGEKDTLVLKQAGSRWRYSVCRRFESAPRGK